jgi:hypothetical protein
MSNKTFLKKQSIHLFVDIPESMVVDISNHQTLKLDKWY